MEFQKSENKRTYPHLFKPFEIRDLVIPNRILMAPMGNNLADDKGFITPRTIGYYTARARGGVGMIITEAVAVNQVGKHRAGGLCLFKDSHEDGLAKLVDAVHKEGSKVATQLIHAGRLVDPNVSGETVVGPSEISAPLRPTTPRSLSVEEIQETVADFAQTAQRAANLGFDAVEIHGAHGYLVHQFFSPRSNQRQDSYGGNVEGRMRFHLQIVKAVREAVGDNFPIIFRISGEEFVDGGYPLEDAIQLGKALKNAGVDILHVSAGTVETPESSAHCIQPQAMPEGCLIPYAERFRKEIGPPVIGVGRIIRPELAEQALKDKQIDLLAMGRSLLADPAWPNKAANRSKGPIRGCIACNKCLEGVLSQNPISCSVNPLTGNEDRFPPKQTSDPKKIAVVGAGPAGLEAACTADSIGHQVILYEKEDRIGGQLWEASIPPMKQLLESLVHQYELRLQETDIEIRLGEEFTEQSLQKHKVDTVILATGSHALRPSIPGAEQKHVVTARDALLNPTPLGQRVLVAGGGLVGCETAEFLANGGRKVHLIEMLDDIAMDVEVRAKVLLLQRLDELGVEITTSCQLTAISGDGIMVEVDGKEKKILADAVVLALGSKANNELEIKLKEKSIEIYTIGDCREPANIKDAIHQGFRAIYEDLG